MRRRTTQSALQVRLFQQRTQKTKGEETMTEKEMIEEMARDILEIDVYHDDKCKGCTRYICNDSCDDDCFTKLFAKYFYNLHYRKIPEGSVVLSKEEYERLKGCENTIKRFSKISPTEAEIENKVLKEEIAIILAQKRNIWKLYKEEVAKNNQERKETAKEIFKAFENRLSLYYPHGQILYDVFQAVFETLAKQFGVEVEE